MKCFNCGNEMEDEIKCPFCGYINKKDVKDNIKIDKNNEHNKKDNVQNNVFSIILNVLCYLQVGYSIIMSLICFAVKRPFIPFLTWIIVAVLFIPKVKQIIIDKNPNIKKWVIPLRIILIIVAMIIFIVHIPYDYENEWISNSGIEVNLKDNIADIIEDGKEYHGKYTTKYVDGITNIYISCDEKDFTFYYKFNDDIVEFYYMKENNKINFRPKVKNSNYQYVE